MTAFKRFEEIEGWQLARDLTKSVYELTKHKAFSKDWGLKDQIQRAAGSSMHNIAEGFDAGSRAEFARFLRYAQRSCTEVQSELYVALDQGYITREQFTGCYDQAAKTKSKVGALIQYLVKNQ